MWTVLSRRPTDPLPLIRAIPPQDRRWTGLFIEQSRFGHTLLTIFVSKGYCTMTLRELAKLTATPERQIRFMIAEGFVPPPTGGRTYADYGEEHVTAVRRYTKLREQGLPPQAIRVLSSEVSTVPFSIGPGISLHVETSLVGSKHDVNALTERAREVFVDLFVEHERDGKAKPAIRKRTRS